MSKRKPDNLVALHYQETGSYEVKASPLEINPLDKWALQRILGQKAEIERLRNCIDRQARSAKTGMDAAKKGALIMEQNARKMLAESSPEALESERAANAVLTDRVSELEQALREARANMEDWGNYAPEYFQEKHGLERDLAAIDEVLGGAE